MLRAVAAMFASAGPILWLCFLGGRFRDAVRTAIGGHAIGDNGVLYLTDGDFGPLVWLSVEGAFLVAGLVLLDRTFGRPIEGSDDAEG
ncbi:MAG: hypothetical protein AAF532_09670 [Planctomycetota bacterium]